MATLTTNTANNTIAGYTCSGCNQWIATGIVHYCTGGTFPYHQQYCQKCGVYGIHTCPAYTPQPTTTYTNLYQLDQIVMKLDQLLKRIEKIEQILDEEL